MRRLVLFAVVLASLSAAACASDRPSSRTAGARRPVARTSAAPAPSAPSIASTPAYVPSRAPSQPAFAATAGGPIPYDAKDLSLDQALAAGRAAGKPVALYILSSSCGYCTRLEASTLTDGTVQREMSRFYNVRIDSRSANGSPIARQYAKFGYPHTAVLDAAGSVRGNIVGYEDPARYSGDLHRIP